MNDRSSLSSVFKAYDIRGLAPEQIDADFAFGLGKAVMAEFGPKKVLVGRDMRTTSFALESALIEGLTQSGADVVRIGLCSTPMFNVLLGLANGLYDLGIMITASHNPGKYNGFKITKGDCLPIGEGSGMEAVRDAFLVGKEVKSEKVGTVTDDATALDRYLDHVLSLAKMPDGMPKIKVAIDAGNGMAGAVLPKLLTRLPWLEAVPLYFEPDGTFPNHEANPLKVETLNHLVSVVKNDGCVMGVAFDGDADRVGFVDEKGAPISGDLMTAFLAEEILREKPGGLVHYDVRSSWAVPEAVSRAGGKSQICMVGHAKIKKLMRETKAVFSGELSMHFYFSDLWNCESGDLAMLLVIRRMVELKKSLSEIFSDIKIYHHSGEINFEVQDKAGAIRRIEETYGSKATLADKTDGVRLEFRDPADKSNDWWVSVRASNTEPLLRLNVEAATLEKLEERVKELTALIKI